MSRSRILRFLIFTIVILGLSGLSAAVADVGGTPRVDTSVTLAATPLVPFFSVLTAEVPLAVFGVQGPLAQARTKSWYFATSPFFSPTVFYELGVEALYGFGDPDEPWLSLGVGTAFSQQRGVTSIPLAVETVGDFRFGSGLSLVPSLLGLIYANGFITELDLKSKVSFVEGWPYLVVGGYAELAVNLEQGGSGLQYGLLYGLGTKW